MLDEDGIFPAITIIFALLFMMVAGMFLGAPGQVRLVEREWHCTASRVVKDTLPREEECTQFTRTEGK